MSNDVSLQQGERLDDLQNHGMKILQKVNGYRFSMDSVLLAHFTRLSKNMRIADLGTGSGIIPLLMSQRETTARFFAFENQPEMAD
ncbi:MAG TPA: SAM-dependent methyltransferase, partial [Candidatus Limiplasma sp.]|nr:SAM-dependent methyltransferase [Candidatus Limiplasma sp.]